MWFIDVKFLYKNEDICEIIRVLLWTIWKERNIVIFEGANYKFLRSLENSIITLV
jgi:hypothetical protein